MASAVTFDRYTQWGVQVERTTQARHALTDACSDARRAKHTPTSLPLLPSSPLFYIKAPISVPPHHAPLVELEAASSQPTGRDEGGGDELSGADDGGREGGVCVTGASGYIASWLVKLLLARGYTVRGTVRDTADPKKTLHLRALDGAKDRLHLFKASLLEEGSFDTAIDGCECVFHTASPFHHNVKDPQVDFIDPAVNGTLNVLRSCKKASIKRVVVTSSMAAVAYNGKPRTPDVVVDETWFSLPEFCEKNQQWYVLSKTLAEEAAWKFSKDNGFEIVTINPAMVIGPLLQPTLNTSAEAILKLINGSSSTYPNFSFGWINVKDVAMAHILAYEVPSANGRYCMVERVAHYSELVKMIREMYPNIALPDKCADDKPFVPTYQVSKDKIRSLGMELISLETSIKETIESLKEKGFVAF